MSVAPLNSSGLTRFDSGSWGQISAGGKTPLAPSQSATGFESSDEEEPDLEAKYEKWHDLIHPSFGKAAENIVASFFIYLFLNVFVIGEATPRMFLGDPSRGGPIKDLLDELEAKPHLLEQVLKASGAKDLGELRYIAANGMSGNDPQATKIFDATRKYLELARASGSDISAHSINKLRMSLVALDGPLAVWPVLSGLVIGLMYACKSLLYRIGAGNEDRQKPEKPDTLDKAIAAMMFVGPLASNMIFHQGLRQDRSLANYRFDDNVAHAKDFRGSLTATMHSFWKIISKGFGKTAASQNLHSHNPPEFVGNLLHTVSSDPMWVLTAFPSIAASYVARMTRDIVESGTKKPIDEEYDKITQSFRKAPIIRDIKLEGVLSWGDRIAGNNPLLKVLVGPSIKAISKGILEFGIIFPLFAGGIAGIMQAVGEWLDRQQENKRAKDPAWKFAQQHPPPGLQSQIEDRDSGLASAGA